MQIFYEQEIYEVKKGDILLSEPLLPDNNFSRAVIIICDVTNDSHMGFIINKVDEVNKLQDVITGYQDFDKELHYGGPVQENFVQTLHTCDKVKNAVSLGNGLYWGGDFETIKKNIINGNVSIDEFKFFIGYSGWEKGQLREELKQNSWLVLKHDLIDVINTPINKVWKKCMASLGEEFNFMSNFPVDPRMN